MILLACNYGIKKLDVCKWICIQSVLFPIYRRLVSFLQGVTMEVVTSDKDLEVIDRKLKWSEPIEHKSNSARPALFWLKILVSFNADISVTLK